MEEFSVFDRVVFRVTHLSTWGGKKTKNKMLDTIDCLTVDLGMSRYLLENVGGGGGGVREEEDWVKQNSKSGWIF